MLNALAGIKHPPSYSQDTISMMVGSDIFPFAPRSHFYEGLSLVARYLVGGGWLEGIPMT